MSSGAGARPMPLKDFLAALLIAIVWGVGFIAMKIGVRDVPPVSLSVLRFGLAAFPWVFFIPAPKTKPSIIFAYGVAIGVMQFGLVFSAIKYGLPAGLTSLLMQSQVFFTILFAWVAMGERPNRVQISGGLVALSGVALIGYVRAEGAALVAFLLCMGAAMSWSLGNIIGKYAGRVDMLAFTVWSSLYAIPPLIVVALVVDGRDGMAALLNPGWPSFFSAVFLAYAATLLGYSLWANLLSRYPAAVVAPFSLLVPVFGFVSSQIVFDEPTSGVEYIGGALVLAGLSWIVFGARAMATARRA